MAAQNSVYESAHKGDYDFVKNEIDANPELVFKADNVSIKPNISNFFTVYIFINESY